MHVADGRRDDGRGRRQRDRRRGLGEVVAFVARAVAARGDGPSVRTAFEEALMRVLPVRSIALREPANRWPPERPDDEVESLAFEVAAPTPAQRGVMQAAFDRSSRPGDWDFQLLGQAAQLGALVLDLDRARGPAVRTPNGTTARPRRDGAAPLIGSTSAMAGAGKSAAIARELTSSPGAELSV